MKYSIPISVVMPCYNQGTYLFASINSILQQTFQHFELIIINDGSTDNSDNEITQFSDKRIQCIHFKKNKGNYVARNLGMRMAKGKYICVMDADDIANPERLCCQFEYLEQHKRIGCVGAQGEIIDRTGKPLGRKLIKPTGSPARLKTLLLMDNFLLHPSLMFRSNLLRRYNLFYNEGYKFSSDYDFVVRSSSLFPVINIENNLVEYRVHGGQISSKSRIQQIAYADQIRRKQLKKFHLQLFPRQVNLYLSLMKRSKLEDISQLMEGMGILNKILCRNCILKLYSQKHLYSLFDFLFSEAKTKI